MRRRVSGRAVFIFLAAAVPSGCAPAQGGPEVTLVIGGQALIKKDPRHHWEDPLGSLRPILQAADVGFTNFEMATAPVFLDAEGVRIALVAATTSHDERSLIHHAVNGVWTGREDDWVRNLDVVRDASSRSDLVIYYHHLQIDEDEFVDVLPGDSTADGHLWVEDVPGRQTEFARAVLDAGASMYLGDGAEAILIRFRDLSAAYGTSVTIENGRAVLELR